jgi:dihydroneopterin aldolase
MIDGYTLRLEGIRFRTHIGASHSERSLPQELVVDLRLALPVDSLPARDRRQDAVDYNAIVNLVVREARTERYRLLETYARRLVECLLRETPALRVWVAVAKVRVPVEHEVGRAVVELEALRRPGSTRSGRRPAAAATGYGAGGRARARGG